PFIMKLIYTFACLLLFVFTTYCQDQITYKNGKVHKVSILTTSETTITCLDLATNEQFTIAKSLLSAIEYQAGKVEPLGVVLPTKVKPKTVLPKDTMVNRLLGYEKGKLIYKGQTYRKWTVKELKKIILYKPDSFLESNLDDYASLRTSALLFQIGGGAMLGHTLYDMMYYERLNGGLFAASIGITALGLLLQSSANSRLRDVINIYNRGILERKVSFSPLIYQSDYNRMNVGVALHF
nr:hypothetical protein [Flectobacillus sp.]